MIETVTIPVSEYVAKLKRMDALETENERLMSLCQQWSESCTGRHGSQSQCVEPQQSQTEGAP
jgi:hypothetical protein